jgi:hypothetical protein
MIISTLKWQYETGFPDVRFKPVTTILRRIYEEIYGYGLMKENDI